MNFDADNLLQVCLSNPLDYFNAPCIHSFQYSQKPLEEFNFLEIIQFPPLMLADILISQFRLFLIIVLHFKVNDLDEAPAESEDDLEMDENDAINKQILAELENDDL